MLKFHAMLDREIKLASADLSHVDDQGVFAGYASLFGVSDLGNDVVERGAFAKTLARGPSHHIRMLFQHDPCEVIGAWTEVKEDERGLRVEGKLCLEVERARNIHALMRAKALDGLSIGFKTVKGRTDPKTGRRHLVEIDLHEISVVTFPMLPQARVAAVKTAETDTLPSIRTFERWLSRDAGFSRKQAQTIVRSGYAALLNERDAVLPPDETRIPYPTQTNETEPWSSRDRLAASMRQATADLYRAACRN